MFGDGIFTQEAESWKFSRELLRQHLTHKTYQNLTPSQEPFKNFVEELPRDSGVVDLQPLFFRFTLDVATGFLFGKSVQSLESSCNGKEPKFAAAFDIAQGLIIRRFRLQSLYWLVDEPTFRYACQMIHAFADQIIDSCLSATALKTGSSQKYGFLEAIAGKYDDREARRGQIINIIAASRDTTACLLSWTL